MSSRTPRPVAAEISALVDELRAGPLTSALFEDHERFVAITDLDGTVAAVNTFATSGTEFGEADFVGQPLWNTHSFRHDRSAEGTWRTRFAEALSTDGGLHFDDEYVDPDGAEIAVRAEVSVVRRADRTPIGFVVQGTNVNRARRIEQKLREQERLRRLTFEQSYQIMALLSPDGTVLDVNAAIERIGAKREHVIGRNLVELARRQPDDGEARAATWIERLRVAQTASRAIHYEDTLTDRGGHELRVFDCTLMPVRDEDTGVLQFLLYEVHDRTESHEAAQRLRRSEERLRELAEAVPQMLWISSADHGVEYFSPRWVEFTGRPLDQLLGRGFMDLVHPDDRDHIEMSEITDADGSPLTFRLRRHDGEYRWVEARARSVVSDEDGVPTRWFGGTADVTDRRQAEADAKAQQAQLLVALGLTNLGRYELDLRDRAMVVDARFSEILGQDGAKLMADEELDGFFNMIDEDHRVRVREALDAAMVPGGPDYNVVYPITRVTPDGPERRWITALGRVEFDAKGALRMVGVVEDITEKRTEDEARVRFQKLEAMGTLAGGIAHDFNNVIGAILSYARVAEAELAAGASPAESLSEIARGALRAGDLTKRLLTFAREEPVRQIAMNLGDVVSEAAALVRPTLPRGTELEVSVAAGLPPVLGDSTQLHQVVVNLITNAGQALTGREHGRISVSVEQIVLGERRTGVVAPLGAGDYLRLRVVDDGPGIPEAILGRIFDPFFTTKGPNEGTGLGLAAVHSIIRNHRGVIAAEDHLAGGAMFTAYLPVQSSPQTPEPVTQPAQPADGNPSVAHVLFVDDEEALVRLAYRAMPYCGCEVTGFTDPLAAADAFAADPDAFDAVVTDLSMPGLTGLELTERVRAIRSDVPVVLTSGYMATGDQDDAQRRGVNAILPKPCSIDDLAAEVLKLLAAR